MCVLSLFKLVEKSYAECYIEYKLDFVRIVRENWTEFFVIE